MPTLQFKGKSVIWNHHLSVPYHTLEEDTKLSFQPDKGEGNLIIEGDNLIALKSLLPMYQNKIKCIYIDPPYNTGNEGWAYNDNVNSPMIKEWLGKEVGKDDLTRHDKWLCMMTPRLKLLRELLSDDGAIFVSIDDNELHDIRLLMDEVFNENNFRNIAVIRRGIKSVQAQFETVDRLNYGLEYVVVYTKNEDFRFKKFEIELENSKGGGWNNHWRGTDRKKMRYEIFGIKPTTGQWRWSKARSITAIDNYKEMIKEIGKPENEISQEEIDTWYLSKLSSGEDLDLLRMSSNDKPEHFVPPSDSKLASNLWSDLKPNGSSQLKSLFGKKVFENPKSVDLIKRVIRFIEGENSDSIILDSFGGSGTTAQAVLELNNEDDVGRRKFILVQMTEASEKEPKKNICKDITRERVKRAIEKYDYNSGFRYQRIGMPIDAEAMLSGKLPEYTAFAKYVFWLCTGEYLKEEKKIHEKDYFVGEFGGAAVYLVYRQNFEELTRLALNLGLAEKIIAASPGKRIIVYAPACFLDEDYLREKRIEFVGIPYNLFQKNMK